MQHKNRHVSLVDFPSACMTLVTWLAIRKSDWKSGLYAQNQAPHLRVREHMARMRPAWSISARTMKSLRHRGAGFCFDGAESREHHTCEPVERQVP